MTFLFWIKVLISQFSCFYVFYNQQKRKRWWSKSKTHLTVLNDGTPVWLILTRSLKQSRGILHIVLTIQIELHIPQYYWVCKGNAKSHRARHQKKISTVDALAERLNGQHFPCCKCPQWALLSSRNWKSLVQKFRVGESFWSLRMLRQAECCW